MVPLQIDNIFHVEEYLESSPKNSEEFALRIMKNPDCRSAGIEIVEGLIRENAWVKIKELSVYRIDVKGCVIMGSVVCELADARYVGVALLAYPLNWGYEEFFLDGLVTLPDKGPNVPRWGMSMQSGGPYAALVRRDKIDGKWALRAFSICKIKE